MKKALYGLKQTPRPCNRRTGFVNAHKKTHFIVRYIKMQIFISQKIYAKEILKKFEMLDCEPVSTPMECGVKLLNQDDQEKINQYSSRLWLEAWVPNMHKTRHPL